MNHKRPSNANQASHNAATPKRRAKRKKRAHLLGFCQNGVNSHATGMWRAPQDKVNLDWTRPEYWEHMGRVMERGMFTGIFIADELAPYNHYRGRSDDVVQYASQCPVHEPSTIVPIIARATENLGIGLTLSTAFEHPYSLVRRLSSLDHLSGGRIAWNIVSSYAKSEWDAYGQEVTGHDERYERMEEYLDLCYQLWDSWEPDAIVADPETGMFADPAKVHEVHFDGQWFSCHARSFVERSPQGFPVLWQAGSSGRGRDFAATHAEAIFAILPNISAMRAYADDVQERAEKCGRPRNSIKLIYGLQTVVAETRSEAEEKYERLKSLVSVDGALAMLSGHAGMDFSRYRYDEHIEEIEVPGIRGVFESLIQAKDGEPLTLAEAGLHHGFTISMPLVVGTAADVVDQMEYFMDEGGADGFNLAATYTPGCFEDIANLVSPELQRRGRLRTEYVGKTLRENLLEDSALAQRVSTHGLKQRKASDVVVST